MNKPPNELALDFMTLTIIPRLLELSPRNRWLVCDVLIQLLAEFSQTHGKAKDDERHYRNGSD